MATIPKRKPLFDNGVRSDNSPKTHDESDFGFLNRTADPRFAQGRLFFQEIFARYPEQHQDHLRSRFRSERPEQHQGAVVELLLFASLGSHGVEVSAATPDFCVGSGDSRWWLEVTSLSPERFDMPKGVRTVVDTIARELRSSDYYLYLSLKGSKKSTPSKEQYLTPLRDLLDTPWDESPPRRKSIQIDDLTLRATLMRKRLRRANSHSVIGILSYGDGTIGVDLKTSRAIRKTLGAKARKTGPGAHGERVWLAVAIPDDKLATGFDDLILHALYGVDEFGSVADSEGSFWFRRDRTRVRTSVEGVVVLGSLLWWALEHQEMFCRVYQSPWTNHRPPMPIRRLPTVRVREDRKIIRSDGERFGTLIGEQFRRFL